MVASLYPNLGYGDQPPPQGPPQRPPLLVDPKEQQPLPKPQPKGPPNIYGQLNPMVAALQGQRSPAMSGLFGVPPQKLAEYIIRGQYQAPSGDPRQVIQPVGDDLPTALKAMDRMRLFPNPPALDPSSLKLQYRL